MNRNAQIWGLDLIIATIIFTIGIILFYNYSVNMPSDTASMNDFLEEGIAVSSVLLSEGFPADWNSINVIKLGINSDSEINETKLQRMLALAQNDYGKTKELLGTKYDYYFLLKGAEGIIYVNSSLAVEGIGKQGVNSTSLSSIDARKMIKISRYSVYQKKPVKVEVYLWRQN